MSLFIKLLFASILGVITLVLIQNPAYAVIQGSTIPESVDENTGTVRLKFEGLNPNKTYKILDRTGNDLGDGFNNVANVITYTSPPLCGRDNGRLKSDCNTSFIDGDWFEFRTYRYRIREKECNCDKGEFEFSVARTSPNKPEVSPSNPMPGDTIRVTLSGSKRAAGVDYRNDYEVYIDDVSSGENLFEKVVTIPPGGSVTAEFTEGLGVGQYRIRIDDKGDPFLYHTTPFTVEEDGGEIGDTISSAFPGGFVGADETSLLPTRVSAVVNPLVTFFIAIAGGVAFLLLIYGGFKFMFSMGNPENVQQGREIITAAIIGLLIIVFSIFILRLIGISILGLPI